MLIREILLCNSHKYLSLPLIPVEEFLELFPEHRESSENDLMIARINHEHAEREKLEQARHCFAMASANRELSARFLDINR